MIMTHGKVSSSRNKTICSIINRQEQTADHTCIPTARAESDWFRGVWRTDIIYTYILVDQKIILQYVGTLF
jgi:hypothetical protein